MVNKRGQISMEFMISILAVLIVFVFCLGMFIERSDMNLLSVNKWSADNAGLLFSRNINSVSLMDNNSTVCDYIYWNEPDQNISLNERSIQLFYNSSYSDSSLNTNNIVWGITDINGLICFSKKNNRIYVEYKE